MNIFKSRKVFKDTMMFNFNVSIALVLTQSTCLTTVETPSVYVSNGV